MRWNLTRLYPNFTDESFRKDWEKLSQTLDSLESWEPGAPGGEIDRAENFIKSLVEYYNLYSKLLSFAHLTVSTDARNEEALKIIEEIEKEGTRLTGPQVRFQRWLGSLEDLPGIIEQSPLLQEHRFFLEELIEKNKYLLSENEESIIANLKRTGSSAWTKLQQKLTSTLMVEVEIAGEVKTLPLPEVRNLAFKKDPQIRRNGYEAELKAYERIEEPVAAALNGIKGEVLTVTEKRGFNHPLEETLLKSRMEKDTLEAMLETMEDYLPLFREYYRTKAELLDRGTQLPFYDIFAPLGEVEMEFTLEEAKEFIIDNVKQFSREMAELYEKAFDEDWIDAEPREGKRGGAFCANLKPIGESRILSNFTGSFNDMSTLAHELGHAYHGHCLTDVSILNASYPMPLAETASILSETIVTNAAIEEADPEQAFAILESRISQAGQVIVDIYSRYLFESKLFEHRKKASLSIEELKNLMQEAQKEAYGDALNHDYLHPYAWLNKPHYYMAGNNYYNFPYAFGLLFGLGIYALYQERGSDFIDDYNTLLKATGQNKIADVAGMVGIDLNSRGFWDKSFKVIEKDINDFTEQASRRIKR